MNKLRRRFISAGLALGVLLYFGATWAQSPQFVPRAENPEDYPAGAGRDDAFYACTACHGFKLVASQGLTRRQWEESLQWMYDKHKMPVLLPKEREIVLKYLESTFPPRQPGGWKNPFAK